MKILLMFFVFLLLFSCAVSSLKKNSLEQDGGLIIKNFAEESSLREAGAKVDDIIWKYDGQVVYSLSQLHALKQEVTNDKVEVVLKRGNELLTLEIPAGALGVYPLPIPQEHKPLKDAVVIKGIGKVGWGNDMDVSFFGCLAQLEAQYDSALSYDDLLVLSGYGFRTSFYPGWCPSSPDAICGYDTGSKILDKLGYEYQYYALKDEKNEMEYSGFIYLNKSEMFEMIKDSIDEGYPLLASNLIQIPEWGIITGYQNNCRELFCRTYFDQSEGYDIAWNVPSIVIRLRRNELPELSFLFSQLLMEGTEIISKPEYSEYSNGIAAWEQWIEALDEDRISKLSPEEFHNAGYADNWIYYSLKQARRHTADYLKAHKNDFLLPASTYDNLLKLYEDEAELLQSGWAEIPPMDQNITPEQWTTDMRISQIRILQQVKQKEEKILDILRSI